MNRLIDKGILAICSWIFLIEMTGVMQPVVLFLLVIIISAIGLYTDYKKWIILLLVVYGIACIIQPILICFIPILFYDCSKWNIKFGFLFGIILFVVEIQVCSSWQIVLWVAIGMVSIVLEKRSSHIERIESELIRLRDSSTELAIVLKTKNKTLIENQEYEIHLATLSERNRIARDIHDNVGHMLSRSILQVGALLTINKDEALREYIVGVKNTLDSAMTSIRESVHDIHGESIDLEAKIKEIVVDMKDVKINIEYDITNNVPRTLKYCFITTVKEAMSNVMKHSNATRVSIVLREHPAFYQLYIEDNGTKIHKNIDGGIGLENMRERVEAYKGTFKINTDKGFKIFISVPKGK